MSDLTSATFLAAFYRFTSRRGLPSIIYSDNGTTFQGANKELQSLFKSNSEFIKTVAGKVSSQQINWSFIPPHAPHFGGIWEAAVRSFKYHLKRVIGESTLTFEELYTLATQIEACLNSRPLCSISVDGKDPFPLTPGHFLIGTEILSAACEFDVVELNKNFSNRWKLILSMKNSFWIKWRKEVLNQLTQRNKWFHPQRNFEVNDIVIVKDDFSSPTHWPLGRVTEVHKGKDELIRVVTIKIGDSYFKRAVNKLIYLPIDSQATSVYLAFFVNNSLTP